MPTLHSFRTRLWIGSLNLSCQLLLGVPRPCGLENRFPKAYAGLLAALESIFGRGLEKMGATIQREDSACGGYLVCSFRPLMFDALSLSPFTLNLQWPSARSLQKALLSGYHTELCRRNCHFAAFRRRRMPATSYVQMDMVAQLHSWKDRYLVCLCNSIWSGWLVDGRLNLVERKAKQGVKANCLFDRISTVAFSLMRPLQRQCLSAERYYLSRWRNHDAVSPEPFNFPIHHTITPSKFNY